MSESDRAIEILLVEDNPADVRLTIETLKEAKVRSALRVASDGEQAMQQLRDRTRRRPELVLLDLDLPGKDGREVLEEMKADPELASIPVVVLTTSNAEEDVLRSYRLHASCYITKPVDLDQFIRVVHAIRDFWLSVVRLPPVPV